MSIKDYLPTWQGHYSQSTFFTDWHADLVRHNPNGNCASLSTGQLNTLWTPAKFNAAGAALLQFDQKTQLGNLPAITNVPDDFLLHISNQALNQTTNLWVGLVSHYTKHGADPYEQPILDACANALQKIALNSGFYTLNDIQKYFPGQVVNAQTYGMLAISALVLHPFQLMPGSCFFYSPYQPQKVALTLNIEIPDSIIQPILGRSTHGVRIGIALANFHTFPHPKGHPTPLETLLLVPEPRIVTTFATNAVSAGNLNMNGYFTHLHLV